MKATVFSFFLIILALNGFAQPTLTSDAITPIGSSLKMWRAGAVIVGTFSPGSSGANVNWNFSNLDTLGGSRIQYAVQADTTPYAFDFPVAANYAVKSGSQVYPSYSYARLDNSVFESYGYVLPVSFLKYENPQKVLTFPFTFNSQFTDIFHTNDSVYYGSTLVKADAYGTVQLPYGATFSNVLRINIKDDYREITNYDFFGNPSDSTMYEGQYYRWYVPGISGPVLEYSKVIAYLTYLGVRYDFDSTKNISFRINNPVGLNEIGADFFTKVFPNPTTGLLNIESSEEIQKVDFTDILGKTRATHIIEAKYTKLNLENFEPGVYFCVITTTDNRTKTIKLIHH